MKSWNELLTKRDKEVMSMSGYGVNMGFGKRPVIMIIDVSNNFVGDKPEPILESVKRWRNSCGEEGWEAISHIQSLIKAARGKRIPIIYSAAQEPRLDGFDSGRWASKNSRTDEDKPEIVGHDFGNQIPSVIAPELQDIVIRKLKPSVFFGTELISFLVDLQADSLILCGTTTSGCVRATVIDGFSYNYKISVVEDCTFDRIQASHQINLFDMHQKYADVVRINETIEFINSLEEGLFDSQMPSLKR